LSNAVLQKLLTALIPNQHPANNPGLICKRQNWRWRRLRAAWHQRLAAFGFGFRSA